MNPIILPELLADVQFPNWCLVTDDQLRLDLRTTFMGVTYHLVFLLGVGGQHVLRLAHYERHQLKYNLFHTSGDLPTLTAEGQRIQRELPTIVMEQTL